MRSQVEKAVAFQALHERAGAFIIPNPWEAGTAKILASLGFEAAHALAVPFMLTARAENLLHGRNDMADTIRRLQAFETAGADVLYAPGLRTLDEVSRVVSSVNRPVNVVIGWLNRDITLAQLSEAGAKRISVGGALSRLTLSSLIKAGQDMQERGSFSWMREMVGTSEVEKMLG